MPFDRPGGTCRGPDRDGARSRPKSHRENEEIIMVRRLMAVPILFLVAWGIPSARAQQPPQPPPATPTSQEIGFTDNRFSVPTFPMATLPPQVGGAGVGVVNRSACPIAVDSREPMHMLTLDAA